MKMLMRLGCLLLCALMLCACVPQHFADIPQDPMEPPFADSLIITERYSEPEDPAQRLAWRRDMVESKMRQMMSMLWTPEEDIVYSHNEQPQYLKAGRIYRGMPYAHGSGSGMSFLSFATARDENGVYTISGLNGERMTGEVNVAHISNDCADAVFWAWATVSNSIRFVSTNRMTAYQGCIPVGSYVCDRITYSTSTKPILEANGKNTMLECYAQMQKGDGVVRFTDGGQGHAMMISALHIVQTDKGTIDPENSYALVLDQVSGNLANEINYRDESIGETIYVASGVDTKYSFQDLFDLGYLPVTCKELIDPAPLLEESITDSVDTFTYEYLLSGRLESNYRISHAQMVIQDSKGNEVQRAIGYNRESDMFSFRLSQLKGNSAVVTNCGTIDPDALPAGTYRCILSCTVSTGRTVTVRDFTFTK